MPTPRKYANNAERQAAYRARCALQRLTTRIPATPGYRRWEVMIGEARSLLERVTHEMERYYEERSERWQESERGEWFTETMESVDEIVTLILDLPSRPEA